MRPDQPTTAGIRTTAPPDRPGPVSHDHPDASGRRALALARTDGATPAAADAADAAVAAARAELAGNAPSDGVDARLRLVRGLRSRMLVEHARGALDDAMRTGDEAVDIGSTLLAALPADDTRFDRVVAEVAVALSDLSRVAGTAGDDDRRSGLLRRADDVSARGDGSAATRARVAVAHEMSGHMLDGVVAEARRRRSAPDVGDVARVLVNTAAIVDLRRDLADRGDATTYLDLADSLFVHGRALALGGNGQMAVDALTEAISLLERFDGPAITAARQAAVDELDVVARTFPDVEVPDLDA